MALAEEVEPRLKSAQQLFWLSVLDQEQENVRAALAYSLSHGKVEEGLRLAGALGHYWEIHSHLTEAGRWCAALLDAAKGLPRAGTQPWHAKTLFAAGMIAAYQYEDERALPPLEESLRNLPGVGRCRRGRSCPLFCCHGSGSHGRVAAGDRTFQEAIECSHTRRG